jgi:outer membrane protein assembly factor BamB
MYRGNIQRTGFYETEGVHKLDGIKWRFQTDDEIWSSPVIADGVVYFGSDDDHLYAVDIESGEEVWRFKTGDDIHSSPGVADGIVYISSYDGYVYGVDVKTGQEVWKFDTLGKPELTEIPRPRYDDYLSSPLVNDGVVYIGGLNPTKCFFALDAKSGEEIWHFRATLPEQVRSSPAIYEDTILFGGDFSKFYALDIDTGELKWNFALGGTAGYAPAVSEDGVVFFSSKDAHLYALEIQTGEELWRNNPAGMSWVTGSPAIANGMVYTGTSDGHNLFAVDSATGEEQWSFVTRGYVWSSPVVQGEIVYIGSGNGSVYAVDALNGHELWSFETEKAVYSTPLVADGVVYVTNLDGTLYALQ